MYDNPFICNFTAMLLKKLNIKVIALIILSAILLGFTYNSISKKGISLIYTEKEYAQLTELENSETSSTPLLISLNQAIKFHDDPEIVFIDARDQWDFEEEHIAGAINIAEYKFDPEIDNLNELSRDVKYVLYCGEDDCDTSKRLAGKLSTMNFRYLYVYSGGINEWSSLNLPVETQ